MKKNGSAYLTAPKRIASIIARMTGAPARLAAATTASAPPGARQKNERRPAAPRDGDELGGGRADPAGPRAPADEEPDRRQHGHQLAEDRAAREHEGAHLRERPARLPTGHGEEHQDRRGPEPREGPLAQVDAPGH